MALNGLSNPSVSTGGGGGSGTVTSVGLALPGDYTVTGSTTANTSSASIAHGLAATPAVSNFAITPTGTTNGAQGWWVSSVDATNFVITMGKQATAATATFAWNVELF